MFYEVCMDFYLDTRDKRWKERVSGVKKMIEVLEQLLSDAVFFRHGLIFIHLFYNSRKQAAKELFCNYWVSLQNIQNKDKLR